MDTTINYEVKTEPKVYYLGRLKDFGLGNPEGIPSDLAEASEEELSEYGERVLIALDKVTDFTHYGCVDGRNCICNADGSSYQVRRRQVSGTGHLVEVAMNGDAPVVDTIIKPNADVALTEIMDKMGSDYTEKTGVAPSAHLGGCGGMGGAVADNKAFGASEVPVAFAKTMMKIPEVYEATGFGYSDELLDDLGQRVRQKGPQVAEFLEGKKWDGGQLVEHIKDQEPAGVEDLEVDPTDEKHHGHKERAVLFVLSRNGDESINERTLKENGDGEALVVNIDASIDEARALAGRRKEEGATQVLLANLAKHGATVDRLVSDKTPAFLLVV